MRNSFKLTGKSNFVLHYFDFSLNSIMIAHFLNQNFPENQKSQKKMYFDSRVLLIDFSELANASGKTSAVEKIQNDITDFKALMKQFSLQYDIIKPSQFLDLSELSEQLARVTPGSDYCDDFIKILEKKLLLLYSKQNKIDKVLLNENLEQLATRAFKLLCKSRQNELVSECSTSHYYSLPDNIQICALRPLAERSDKEIYYYTHINKLMNHARLFHAWVKKDAPERPSLNALLSEFILDQQREFIATSSNVQQTVMKLKQSTASKFTGNELKTCQFCITV